ncbi:hypothetical protein DTO271G3_5640 [Paecilomyces variotii]|nr:hypothetical protein DTO271G3_5640 [Paecilomyces variotii]
MDIIKDLKDILLICLSGGAYDCDLGEETAQIQKIADDVLTVLLDAESVDIYTKKELDEIVRTEGWNSCVSEALLSSLINVLKAGASMGTAVKEAFDKATYEAMGFAREHPVYCAVIALGIMVILTPWCLEALGFAELGPIEGTFAARWQCMYAGYVPKGSLFSYFQRLGMVWKH